jgi:hypothetical protein
LLERVFEHVRRAGGPAVHLRRAGDGWFAVDPGLVDGADLAFRLVATDRVAERNGRVLATATLETSLPDGHRLLDTCADVGTSLDDAVERALRKHLLASLPPLVEAVRAWAGPADADPWRCVLGPAVVQEHGPAQGRAGENHVDERALRDSLRSCLQSCLESWTGASAGTSAQSNAGALIGTETSSTLELTARDLHAVRAFVQLAPDSPAKVEHVEIHVDDLPADDPVAAEVAMRLLEADWPACSAPTGVRVHAFLVRPLAWSAPSGGFFRGRGGALGVPAIERADAFSFREIDAAVACFVASAAAAEDDEPDELLEEELVERGFAPSLAARVLAFAPMAFAVDALTRRRGPSDPDLPDVFGVALPSGRAIHVAMRSEPVFVTASAHALALEAEGRHGTADAIARRSPLLHAADADDRRRGLPLPPPLVWSGHAERALRYARSDAAPAGSVAEERRGFWERIWMLPSRGR